MPIELAFDHLDPLGEPANVAADSQRQAFHLPAQIGANAPDLGQNLEEELLLAHFDAFGLPSFAETMSSTKGSILRAGCQG